MSTIPIFTARPRPARWHRPLAAAFVAATVAGGVVDVSAGAFAASATVAGHVFVDEDRDGSRDADDAGFADVTMYLLTEDRSALVGTAVTDASGNFAFGEIPQGTYELQMKSSSWRSVNVDWTPTTTGSLQPRQPVHVGSSGADASMGLRRIVRSTDSSSPITAWTAADGMHLRSYNDVVEAHGIRSVLDEGSLLGVEAGHVTVRHDLSDSTSCSGVATWDGTRYTSYTATCSISWAYWLTGSHAALFHEYGHAWSLYHAYVTQQDPDLTGYLTARGIAIDDPRLGSSHGWSPREMIAEDYRQLFGSPQAQASPQENWEIPPAKDVPGLLEYLRDEFTSAPAEAADPSTSDTEPTPGPDPTPEPEIADTTAPSITIQSPTDGASVTEGPVDVAALVVDDRDHAVDLVVTMSVGERVVTATFDPATGLHRATVDTTGLTSMQTITVRAADTSGTSTEASVTVEVKRKKGGGTTSTCKGKKC
jgi:hypothetical protein